MVKQEKMTRIATNWIRGKEEDEFFMGLFCTLRDFASIKVYRGLILFPGLIYNTKNIIDMKNPE
jgi:hypothetical protein